MFDLQKAFDTVDHDILYEKLKEIGIISVGCFRSYLSDRQQVITVDGATSSPGIVTCGVPQGSIRGSRYVNDMTTSIEAYWKLILYVDDSAILFAHKDSKFISQKLGKVEESCSEWLIDNKLSRQNWMCTFWLPYKTKKGWILYNFL